MVKRTEKDECGMSHRVFRRMGTSALLIAACAPCALATTLFVAYSQSSGAILGIDSSYVIADAAEFEQSGKIRAASTGCKIHVCGRYLVAVVGFWDIPGKIPNTASVCSDIARASPDADSFIRAFERVEVSRANIWAAYMVQHKRPFVTGRPIVTIAAIGYEKGHPILRYREVTYGGNSSAGDQFNVSKKTACPGDHECVDFEIVTGETDAIKKAADNGKYSRRASPLERAEDLLQIEVDANRKSLYVLPPISIVQIRDAKINWLRSGLCAR